MISSSSSVYTKIVASSPAAILMKNMMKNCVKYSRLFDIPHLPDDD
jgi:hypothetical protein